MYPRFVSRASRSCAVLAGAVIALLMTAPTSAQEPTGAIFGRVLTDAGAPAAGVAVTLDGTALVQVTNDAGAFRFDRVPAGTAELVVEQIGWKSQRTTVQVEAGRTARVELRLEAQALLIDRVVVTTSREAQRRAETPATVHAVNAAEIERLMPSHPSELMNRVPGVWVNVTGGEGHMAAIRQPMTTNPVYLYLEDGVPTRSTGFFNHNALYEIDLPHASRVEVVKGPASALYGSDAIGGMVNVMTRSPSDAPPFSLSAEGGPAGFARILAAASTSSVLGEVNVTRTDGWRDGTAYDRQSGTIRWDRHAGPSSLRAVVTYSHIDQNTAGSSALPESDYRAQPTRNLTPISYRQVDAARATLAWERVRGSTLFSVTPFARWNRMEMLPNWSLTYDPAISVTGHMSAGALLKVRRDFQPMQLRAIGGVDIDYSPGEHREWPVATTRTDGVFSDYTRGDIIYDYDVTFRSVSPYVQLEATPLPHVRVVAGLRYDALAYDYDNPLGELQTGVHRRPASTSVSYDHISPKLGVAWAPDDALRVFASYGHGFRAPSEGQLFRQGRADSTIDLQPVRADNVEVGAGGIFGGRLSWDVALYRMRKRDDLLTFTRPDGSTETVNAGATLHRGIELGAALALPLDLRLDLTYALAKHTYDSWRPNSDTDYSGNDMETAPSRTASAGVTWSPRAWPHASAGIDLQHVGPFWMDPANTTRYDGHTLVAIRAELPVTSSVTAFARITNALDTRYAELAQYTAARGSEFAPGMPRALYIGARLR